MDEIEINSDLYQRIYNEIEDYGRASYNHCPGIRLYPHYKDYLKSPIIDAGTGTGDTVLFFRKKKLEAWGLDWIEPNNEYCKKADITLKADWRRYNTVTCFDVIEHLNNAQVTGLFTNMTACKYQIFSISNNSSIVKLKDGTEIDLHINKKPFNVWRGIISDYFKILLELPIRDYQRLYICTKVIPDEEYDRYLIEYLEKKGYKITK